MGIQTRPGHGAQPSGQPRNHVEEGGSPDGSRRKETRVQGPSIEDLQPGTKDHVGTDQGDQGPGREGAVEAPGVAENEGTGQKPMQVRQGRSSSTILLKGNDNKKDRNTTGQTGDFPL